MTATISMIERKETERRRRRRLRAAAAASSSSSASSSRVPQRRRPIYCSSLPPPACLLLLLLLASGTTTLRPPPAGEGDFGIGTGKGRRAGSAFGVGGVAAAAYRNDVGGRGVRRLLPGVGRRSIRDVSVPSVPVRRPLAPPFPDGPCGGTIVEIPQEDLFDVGDKASPAAFLPGGGGKSSIPPSSLLLPPRPVSVWLPPRYFDDSSLRHPVLYCHDGQNAVQDETSWTGYSWRLAGALTRLAERNVLRPVESKMGSAGPVPIVVLLPSADGDMTLLPGVRRRHMEYGDASNPVARAHADWVADVVKPAVDNIFRTVRSSSGTFAIGSSLGGQAAYHLVLRRPDAFGGAAALSPFFGPPTLASAVARLPDLRADGGKVLYMDNGGDVDDSKVPWFDLCDHLTEKHWWNPGYFWLDTQLQPSIDAMRLALDAGGVRYEYRRVAGARHNERAWARRIDRPLAHLFGDRKWRR